MGLVSRVLIQQSTNNPIASFADRGINEEMRNVDGVENLESTQLAAQRFYCDGLWCDMSSCVGEMGVGERWCWRMSFGFDACCKCPIASLPYGCCVRDARVFCFFHEL